MYPMQQPSVQAQADPNEPHIRLLLCRVCKEINELPDYQGTYEDDFLLHELVNAHRSRGSHDGEEIANLFRVPTKSWEDPNARAAIHGQMQKRVPGYESEWYATRNYYGEQAIKCFRQHGEPQSGCLDYCDHSKRLGNPNRESFANPEAAVYICHFCPVQSWVTTQIRARRGDYKRKPGEPE